MFLKGLKRSHARASFCSVVVFSGSATERGPRKTRKLGLVVVLVAAVVVVLRLCRRRCRRLRQASPSQVKVGVPESSDQDSG